MLKAFQELVGERGGFVEAKVGFWIGRSLIRVTLNLLEEPIGHANVVVKVGVWRRAEAMEKTDRAHGSGGGGGGTGLFQRGLEGPEEDVEDGIGRSGAVMEKGSEALGDGEHKLAHRHVGNDVALPSRPCAWLRKRDSSLGPCRRTRPGTHNHNRSTEPWRSRGPRSRTSGIA